MDDLKLGKMEQTWAKGIKALVRFSIGALKDQGHHSLATRYQQDWSFYVSAIDAGPFNLFDLGDHRPIYQWLGTFYDELELALGKSFCEFHHIDDIKAFNYGYIVTFHPNGDPLTNETWDLVEYKKHFVPFATASFYWISYAACAVAAPFPASLGCPTALAAPRYVVKQWVSPSIATEVYSEAKKKKTTSSTKENHS
jgi:hypothetical protein